MWYRFGKSGSLIVKADAEITPAGKLVIFCSAPDYGQGSTTAMSQIAAEILAVPREIIQIINADTYRTPDSGIQGASRATYFVGGAVVQASKQLKNALLETAAELLDCPPSILSLGKTGISCLSEDNKSLSQTPFLTYQELANELHRLNLPTRFSGIFDLTDHFPASNRPEYLPLFVTGVQAAEVLVNLKTGEVKVPKISAVHDVGKIINPQDARGQVEGSILMGVGSALMEEYLPGLTSGFGDYYLPTSMDAPDINTILLEVPGLLGPFGVKGLGEAAVLPAAPAIINGISRTIGTRIYQIPATPELVLKAIQKSGNRPNG
jgi:CO/xanthine dehydrogenase Mo-binding subunit